MKRKRVPLNQSALFRIRSFKRLSLILRKSGEELERLAASSDNYMEYDKGGRWIEAPKPHLKKVQERFAGLLAQIETPEYLHSAVRKRSYVSNAAGHTADRSTVKVDIKKFYRSARSAEVYAFLTDRLEWAGDVAGMAVGLLTVKGHLPTGGNASPSLSFWIYKALFDAIDDFSAAQGLVFSLYVDDMTLSGEFARRSTITQVRKLIGNARLKAHKLKYFGPGTPRVITGVAQTSMGMKLPFARLLKIRDAEERLQAAMNDDERYEALKPLVGRLCEASQIDPITWKRRRDRAIEEIRAIERAKIGQRK